MGNVSAGYICRRPGVVSDTILKSGVPTYDGGGPTSMLEHPSPMNNVRLH